MEILLDVLQFMVGAGVILTGGYYLLKKFVPEVALQIKITIGELLDKFRG